MQRPFQHQIEVYGVKLTVTGIYYPAEPTRFDEPPDSSLIEIHSVCVPESSVDIHILLCDQTKARIEETIERIEA